MRIRILGSCAGGGLPQWNCGCENCVAVRHGALAPRTQPSLAVSADGERWSLLNAAPDIRTQLAAAEALHPRPGTRDLPLDSILLTNADLDHVLGLLVLREAVSYRIVSTHWVRNAILDHNAAWRLVEPAWGGVRLDQPIRLDRDGRLEARFFPVPGKVPRYLEGHVPAHPETTVGIRLTERPSGRRLVFVPGTRHLDAATRAELESADCVFVDGTFFTTDELRRIRPGAPDAFAMAHVPISGPDGSLAFLETLDVPRFYIHMNNTNPILRDGSPEAARVERAGIQIAQDGHEIRW